MDYVKSFLSKELTVTIDRPLGSTHPEYRKMVYPVNYGYIEGTKAPDGEEVDAYVLGVGDPIERFKGICVAVIHRRNDKDDKLVVIPKGEKYTIEKIKELVNFQEKYFDSDIISG